MSRFAKTKTECPLCGLLVYLTPGPLLGVGGGRMFAHGPKANRCAGSGKCPNDARAFVGAS